MLPVLRAGHGFSMLVNRALVLGWLFVTFPAFSPAQDEAPRKHALLIGINRYIAELQGVPKLSFAEQDAKELREMLERKGWDARALIKDAATRDAIVLELARLAKEVRQQDTVLIFFAGHGLRDKVTGDPSGSGYTYLLTYLSTLPPGLLVEGIRLNHLLEYIGDIRAATKIVILDHCFSGDVETFVGSASGARDAEGNQRITRNLFPKEEFDRVVKSSVPRGLLVMGAAREEAYEFPDLKHGLFTYAFLEALNKPITDGNRNGKISVEELWNQAKIELEQIAAKKGITQTPLHVVQGDILGWEPFEASVDPSKELKELRNWLNQLDGRVSLDTMIMAFCVDAIRNWEQSLSGGTPVSDKDKRIISAVKEVRALEARFSAETIKDTLEGKIRGIIQ